MANELKFIKIKDALPAYGEPVLLFTSGLVQHITYCRDRDGKRDCEWFKPYHFDHDDDFKIDIKNVDSWIYVDDVCRANE
tara:strand:+ start:562 stop:801 length:240 start_codon:yes stop_codon:yes gene_type:complete